MENPDVDSWPPQYKDFGPSVENRDMTLERDEGANYVGAAAVYEVKYIETWGSI